MTTLVAWLAVDRNAPSAIYMASESRISWGSAQARWDAGRKLFFCRQHADLFGYTGDVVFPSLVLGQITEAVDSGLLFNSGDDAENRHKKFLIAIKASFGERYNAPNADFQILHCSRQGTGSRAQFKLWHVSFKGAVQSWADDEIHVPTDQSSLLAALGTGAQSLRFHDRRWGSSPQGGTSRAIFSALCDSLRSRTDPFSGGVPQVVGMYHTRLPQAFGIIHDGGRYLHGLPLPSDMEPKGFGGIEWRDELFQRIDGRTLKIIAGAQRHIRPKFTR